MGDGHLMRRAGREFAKNLLWMAVVFGSLAAIPCLFLRFPIDTLAALADRTPRCISSFSRTWRITRVRSKLGAGT